MNAYYRETSIRVHSKLTAVCRYYFVLVLLLVFIAAGMLRCMCRLEGQRIHEARAVLR